MLTGKNIIVGITGGIAAYKSAILVRELVKKGADVKVVMTPLAKQFISPLTMATLSRHPVPVEFFNPENGEWNSHVSLGLWADAFVIAPATANTIGKMANGIADNLLLTTYLSAKCPVFIAPAMDLDMYAHPAVQKNLETLQRFGNHLIEPASGFLASGLEGKGRMEEPENIAAYLEGFFAKKHDLIGKKVLITAGPTYEKIDPVRFIGNYSSGKMGYALAEECAERGAEVLLVSGPVQLQVKDRKIRKIDVESAEEMYRAAMQVAPETDIQILCAAVADYTPVKQESKKIKREKTGPLSLELQPTRDIAAELGKRKKENQLTVGFALETNAEEANATEKCIRKNFDFIVLNSLNDPEAGFRYDTNKVTIINKNGEKYPCELKDKKLVAKDIIDYLIRQFF